MYHRYINTNHIYYYNIYIYTHIYIYIYVIHTHTTINITMIYIYICITNDTINNKKELQNTQNGVLSLAPDGQVFAANIII